MSHRLAIILVVAFSFIANAQKKDKVLLTIDNEPVYATEFLRIYNKNKDVVSDENKTSISDYLELFVNYKLKLKEARDLKLDTVPSYLREYKKYKNQLIEPYLKDREVTDLLIKEAYNRMTKEVKASHILITVKPNAKPKDTLKAYNTILEARQSILNGANFGEVASKVSQDPSARENKGNLGYFSAFSMVYPFENAAYNTPVGNVSMPFRTKFGYHIVKTLDVRASKGEVEVAHIMIHDKKTDPKFAKKQIDDIYNKYKQGENFELLAKQYSDDKSSAPKGGKLRAFSQGRMIQPFADISFALKQVGDVSEPFKTKFGWHIVKLLKKIPVKSFEESKAYLNKKVAKGERSVIIGKSIASKLKKRYTYQFNETLYNTVFLDDNQQADDKVDDKTILTIEHKTYTVNDLKRYLKSYRNKTYHDFIDFQITEYHKHNLEFENPEFANTLQEYRDGLLLFDLLQKKIWTKAEKDTLGLQKFFAKNSSKYVWKQRVKADIASCTNKDKALLVKSLMKAETSIEDIKKVVNTKEQVYVLFNSGVFEVDSNKLPKDFSVVVGTTFYEEDDDKTHFKVINVSEILPAAPKTLNDVKGKVISDYQDDLEKQWIKDLRAKYTVKINKKVFKKIVRKNK